MKILLVDDHQLFLDGLTSLLTGSDLVKSIKTVNNGRDALRLLKTSEFDVALIDLRLPIMDGFSLLDSLAKIHSPVPIIIVSASRDPDDIRRALELGAMSFIPKSSSGAKILETIEAVNRGEVVYHPFESSEPSLQAFSEDWANQHNMTKRQLEVLRLIIQGLSNQAIAEQLNLSLATVKTHISSIFQILNTRSRSESIKKAQQLGLD
ncbi:response regulator transcription factor [Marinobacterium sediminicola]|uniref:DNA-binding response regulator, NarL/FixJ family, contains REC and HTH domains n=1 Tax=Marinobacterium sediminicola TaxID=518898 RepID=A0ABY1S0Y3_9GAMM|nr:response regulator transcription factor [Marinobacterium sediminicola]ULG69839.1 response regulator transcription factor [Marinobacterium sediminicola]SMR75346.1 DNA-binding response regulator, NarL/FixJ family, contains REC and HTH domains [Marinobacterium sediminicola]